VIDEADGASAVANAPRGRATYDHWELLMRAGRPTPAHAAEHTRDDLERISGIGPAIARRLESAGISTYGELAESTPAALSGLLAGIGGTSAGRIAESDWIGQARRLTRQRATGTAAAPALPPAPSAAAPAAPAEPKSGGSALLRVSRLASAGPRSRRGVLRSDEPTFVGIEMVATGAPASAPILGYTADVAARRLDGSGEIPVTRLHGAVGAGQSISHAGSGPSLPPGLYRLVAIVRAGAAGHASAAASPGSEAVSGEIVAVTDASRPDGKRAEDAEAAAQLRAGEQLLAGGAITETEFAEIQATWHQESP
jgi:predicted flap endonuclease-1-like 5' DNA nuclease